MKTIQITALRNSTDKVEMCITDNAVRGDKNIFVCPLDYVSELVRCNIHRSL